MVATIFALTVMVGVGTSTMPPALAAVQRTFGVSPDVAGMLLAVFTLPGLVLTPLGGYLADRVGRRGVLVGSLLLFAAAGAAALSAERFEHLVVVRIIQGIGAASLGALNVTLISDFFDGHERVRLLGFNHSVLSIGTAILPIISGWLAGANWRLPFALPIVGVIVAAGVLLFIPPYSHTPAISSDAPSDGRINRLALALLLGISVATYAVLFGPFLNYLQERIRVLEPEGPALYERIGAMVGLMSVATTLGALGVGRLSQRFPLHQLLIIACALYSAALVLFVAVPSYALLVIPTVLFGLAQALNQPVVQSLVARLASAERRGTVLSLNRSAALLGQTVGPLLFGLVYRSGGLEMVFIAGAALMLACAGALWWRRL
ncbi:MAG: MFS transporter [Candidatus Kapaibacterium sp.]|nr:MAG: MFS transporter [Candidatus Kapabacteria bacterium]